MHLKIGLALIVALGCAEGLPPVGSPNTQVASNLVRVENSPNNRCRHYGCRYYEWKIRSHPDIRYVASGYEDGINYSLYRVTSTGEYELILRVNPIVVDEHGDHWWGYPWVTRDIAIANGYDDLRFMAAFTHEIKRDGEISIPEWQKLMPALLLRGEKGKWNVEQPRYEFVPVTIEELAAPGSLIFHARFFVSLHSTGTF